MFQCPSFIFCYFIFYCEIALGPISRAMKMFTEEMLAAKMLQQTGLWQKYQTYLNTVCWIQCYDRAQSV